MTPTRVESVLTECIIVAVHQLVFAPRGTSPLDLDRLTPTPGHSLSPTVGMRRATSRQQQQQQRQRDSSLIFVAAGLLLARGGGGGDVACLQTVDIRGDNRQVSQSATIRETEGERQEEENVGWRT